jgi:hypothetical protein
MTTAIDATLPAVPTTAPKSTAKASQTISAAAAATPSTATSAVQASSTVKISAGALAALKEARETPAQTAKEAQAGDPVARARLAREATKTAEFRGATKK